MANSPQAPLSCLLHGKATKASLEFYLKFFFAIWFVRYLLDPLQTLGGMPVEYADPVGPLRWIPDTVRESLFSTTGLSVLRFGLLASCIGVWIKAFRPQAALMACLLLTLAAAIPRSFGHINHAELGPIIVTWVLSLFYVKLSASEETNSDDENATASAGLITATTILMFAYAFVGVARLCDGGWQLFVGDTIPNHVSQGSYSNWVLPFDLAPMVLENQFLIGSLKLGTLAVTFLEIAAPFALISKRVRYTVLLVMPMFHIGAILMFKVIFAEQVLALILLINISPLLSGKPSSANIDENESAHKKSQAATNLA